jgi:enoyl-CoA hydratase/carnithine racemase
MGLPKMSLTQSFAAGKIHCTAENGTGSIVISNIARKNALDASMWSALPHAVTWLVDNAKMRVIVMKGDGGKDFCSGADISEFATVRGNAESAEAYESLNVAAFAAVRQAPVPVIAAIRGICFGGGFGLAAACDLRMADHSARFAIPAARLGLAYPVDGIADITGSLGADLARLALYTGQELDNAMLLRRGFLTALVETGQLEQATGTLADTIAANAPLTIRATKMAFRANAEHNPQLFETAAKAGADTFTSRDYAEGRLAFAERRKPEFTGQ